MGSHRTTDFDIARDELFSHIHRCGVLKATEDQQTAWLEDTRTYLGERHPNLSSEQLEELRMIGERFCRPAIPHGQDHTALSPEGFEASESEPTAEADLSTDEEVAEERETVGAA